MRRLLEWKQSDSRKPLILRGARQVGKTSVADELGRTFDNYLSFNMESAADAGLFDMELPVDEFVNLLYAAKGLRRQPGTTLLFIDEIQASPRAIAKMRYFYEQAPWLHVVAAGSLLENLVDVGVSFPVGRVQYMALRPCSFYEFLGALGLDGLQRLVDGDPRQLAPLHGRLLSLFQRYMVVGGMPETVARYAAESDLVAVDDVFASLLQGYQDDAEKYVKGKKLTDVVRFVLSYGWAFAGATVALGNFAKSGYSSREVGEAMRLLQKAMLVELVYPTSSPLLPVVPELNRQAKLIWHDTGLVNYQMGIRKEILGATDLLDLWRGRIAEQAVAQELLALSDRVGQRRAFWARPNGGAEVDFVYAHDSRLYPIEVKNGHNSRLRSLLMFMQQSPADLAFRIWSGPYSVDDVRTPEGRQFRLVNMPFYLIRRLPDIIDTLA